MTLCTTPPTRRWGSTDESYSNTKASGPHSSRNHSRVQNSASLLFFAIRTFQNHWVFLMMFTCCTHLCPLPFSLFPSFLVPFFLSGTHHCLTNQCLLCSKPRAPFFEKLVGRNELSLSSFASCRQRQLQIFSVLVTFSSFLITFGTTSRTQFVPSHLHLYVVHVDFPIFCCGYTLRTSPIVSCITMRSRSTDHVDRGRMAVIVCNGSATHPSKSYHSWCSN